MVKYAEDQHKKKDRRSQLLVGPMASNMMENSYSYEGHMNPDARDPYLYSRGRGSQPGMYRTQQSPAQMNLMSQSQQGNHNFSSSSTANYLSRESGKGASPSMSPSSVSNINSSDWYSQGQMFQGVMYDHQMGNPQAHMSSNQSLNYDQHAMDQHMISQGQRSSHNQGQNQNQGQGTLYMRPNRVTNESGYDGAVAIIISFLPQHADVALLHDLCAPYGRIVSAQIDVDNNSISPEESSALGGCTGRGRVKLSTMSQAQYAAQTLNGAIIFEGGRPLRVSI